MNFFEYYCIGFSVLILGLFLKYVLPVCIQLKEAIASNANIEVEEEEEPEEEEPEEEEPEEEEEEPEEEEEQLETSEAVVVEIPFDFNGMPVWASFYFPAESPASVQQDITNFFAGNLVKRLDNERIIDISEVKTMYPKPRRRILH